MMTRRPIAALPFILLVTLGCPGNDPAGPARAAETRLDEYAGRYRLNEDQVLRVDSSENRLRLLPSLWRRALILEPTGRDEFRSLLHPDIEFSFVRDAGGAVVALACEGHRELGGRAGRLGDDERFPVEYLLEGNDARAFELLARGGLDIDRAVGLGVRHFLSFPSRSALSVAFAERIAHRAPESADAQLLLASAQVQAGRRADALAAFRAALEVDPASELAAAGIRHLAPELAPADASGEDLGWELPFDLGQLFAPPSAREIERVRELWRARDLLPREVESFSAGVVGGDAIEYEARIVSHRIGGSLHYGAVLVPSGAIEGCCPVVLDVRGVSWDYRPRDITGGTRSMDVLGEHAGRFIHLVPGLRGETLELLGESYLSEGDRRNGWDGAADDVIAFLGAALKAIPEADPERVCLFGKSRGATVALLAAARDPRVDCVVGWAGPADWFAHMGNSGWTLEELVEDGLRNRWRPGEGRGSAAQFIERVLEDTIEHGRPGLANARLEMTVSSPLYFLDSLPPASLHYGVEDRSVPVDNGRALERRLRELGRPEGSVHLHAGAGHDMPWPEAYDLSRDFLLLHLEGDSDAQ